MTPTSGSQNGDYTVTVTFTPTEGINIPTYTATIISVTCTVDSFSAPVEPSSDLSYEIFSPAHTIKVTGDYIQSPPCGYTFQSSFTHTIEATSSCTAAIAAGTVFVPSFVANSVVTSHAGTCTVQLGNSITINSGQG